MHLALFLFCFVLPQYQSALQYRYYRIDYGFSDLNQLELVEKNEAHITSEGKPG